MRFLLTLGQENPRAGNLVIRIGAGEVAGQEAHLGGKVQQFRLHLPQIGVLAQMVKAGADGFKLA